MALARAGSCLRPRTGEVGLQQGQVRTGGGGRLTGSPAGGFRPVLSHLLEHLLCVCVWGALLGSWCAGEKWPLATGTGAASRRGGTHLGEERAHLVALAQS